MRSPMRIVSWLLLLVLAMSVSAATTAADGPVVRAVLFWSRTCPHCHKVLTETLPPLQERYGSRLEIYTVEVSDPDNYEVWAAAMDEYQVPANRRGVPMLFIGDQVLVGSAEIPEKLPGLIEQYLAAGGVDYPDIPGLVVEESPVEETATPAALPSPAPTAAQEAAPIHVAYFYQPGCQECDRVQLALNYLSSKYPQMVVHSFDVKENAPLCEWLGERAGVPEEKLMTAPAVFVGGEGLVGDDLDTASLEALLSRHADGAEPYWEGWEESATEATSAIIERFRSFGLLTVMLAGLVDGLNPCAFATLVFFISYLSFMGRRGREILAAGASFALGVFLTYLGVGMGVLKFLTSVPFLSTLGRWMYGLTAALCCLLAVGSLYDWWQARHGKHEEMRLKLPPRLRRWVNRTVREGAGVRAFLPVTFVTGVVISLIELACTGQVYLPTILFVLGVPELRMRAGVYLVLYNLMFVFPLVIVFGLAYFGTTSRQLGMFIHKHTAAIKLGTAALFLLLAGWMVTMLV